MTKKKKAFVIYVHSSVVATESMTKPSGCYYQSIKTPLTVTSVSEGEN